MIFLLDFINIQWLRLAHHFSFFAPSQIYFFLGHVIVRKQTPLVVSNTLQELGQFAKVACFVGLVWLSRRATQSMGVKESIH